MDVLRRWECGTGCVWDGDEQPATGPHRYLGEWCHETPKLVTYVRADTDRGAVEAERLRLRWNTLTGWHINGVAGLPDTAEWTGEPIEYVRAATPRGAVDPSERKDTRRWRLEGDPPRVHSGPTIYPGWSVEVVPAEASDPPGGVV